MNIYIIHTLTHARTHTSIRRWKSFAGSYTAVNNQKKAFDRVFVKKNTFDFFLRICPPFCEGICRVVCGYVREERKWRMKGVVKSSLCLSFSLSLSLSLCVYIYIHIISEKQSRGAKKRSIPARLQFWSATSALTRPSRD